MKLLSFIFAAGVALFSIFNASAQDNRFIPTSQDDLELIEHQNYILGYSEEHEQAIWVAYLLSRAELNATASRSDNFRPDPIVTTGSAELIDYRGSGYDRGHLAPAADMAFSSTAMSESFYMSNMSPQDPSFNRGIWKKLEERVRSWAEEKGSVYVVTGSIPQSIDKKIGPNQVTVPSYYYKVLLDQINNEAIGFILRNEGSSDDLMTFAYPVDKVEEMTDLDFFSQLPDELEKEAESAYNASNWDENAIRINNRSNVKPTAVEKKRCAGITAAGNQCKRNAQTGSKYCYQHQ